MAWDLAYLNIDATFEFLEQFTIDAYAFFLKKKKKKCRYFWDTARNMVIFG